MNIDGVNNVATICLWRHKLHCIVNVVVAVH